MASLTDTSIIARKVIRYGVYALILIVIAKLTFGGAAAIYRKIFPPKLPPPTVAFGKLPKLSLPEKASPENLEYTLETVDGKLPTFPEQLEVYFMPNLQTSIRVVDDAKTRAKQLEFDPEGKILIENIPNVYVFKKRDVPSTLIMNIVTKVFSISYNIEEDPQILIGKPPPAEAAINKAKRLLSAAGVLEDDLANGPAAHEFLRIEKGKFVKAISLSEADLIKVNFFRKGYGKGEKVFAVTPDMPESNVWFIIAGGRNQQIVAAEYHYFPIDKNKSSTYPIKPAETAWEETKNGQAFIANLGENESGNIVIRKVYLAYYDAGQYSEYYQPVVVFEGDNNFYAFVPAVTDEYYGKEEKISQ